jgi:undecaprenyl-diphosphatase
MPIWHALVLGIVQGLTEFLPISSSGHLILVPWLFGWNDFGSDPSIEKAFDVALHLGTLIAVVGYFWSDLVVYARDGIVAVRRRPASTEGRIAWLIVLATLPALVVGAIFSDTIDEHLGKPWIIAISMIVFALLLGWADTLPGRRKMEEMQAPNAALIGAAQVLALNPGTSRSGITITAGRWERFDRPSATRFSFLLSVPITAGAVVFKLGSLVKDGIPNGMLVPMIVGIIAAGVSGWLAIAALLKYVQTKSFRPFVIYRVIVGIVVLGLLATSWR